MDYSKYKCIFPKWLADSSLRTHSTSRKRRHWPECTVLTNTLEHFMYYMHSLTALWLIPWKLVFSVFSLNFKGILNFYYSWEAVSQTFYHEGSIQTCWGELWSYIQGNVTWLWKSFPEKLIQRYFADSLSLQAHDQNSLSMNDMKVPTLLFPAAVVNMTAFEAKHCTNMPEGRSVQTDICL